METEKACSKCKEIKPLEEFNLDRRGKDGISPRCKDCTRAHGRAKYDPAKAAVYRDANRERRIEGMRRWREENPERVQEYAKEHYRLNKDTVLAYGAEWRAKNPDRFKELYLINKEKNPFYQAAKQAAITAKKYGVRSEELDLQAVWDSTLR